MSLREEYPIAPLPAEPRLGGATTPLFGGYAAAGCCGKWCAGFPLSGAQVMLRCASKCRDSRRVERDAVRRLVRRQVGDKKQEGWPIPMV